MGIDTGRKGPAEFFGDIIMVEDMASSDDSQIVASTALWIMVEVIATRKRLNFGLSQGLVASRISMKIVGGRSRWTE